MGEDVNEKEMEMRILRVGWIGMLLIGFSFFSTALADDSVTAPGVRIDADGSVVAPGVQVDSNVSVSAPGVKINVGGKEPSASVKEGRRGKIHVVSSSDQTIDLVCNGENVVVSGSDNTITCHGKSAKVSVNGSGNTIRFKGTCNTLILTGADNQADMERIGAIKAVGSGNRVTWVFASRGEKPKIVSTGQDNVIKQIK